MSKHTPGPWELSYDKGSTRDIVGSRGKPTLCMVRLSWVSLEEYHANARLIASAPELLEALKDIIENISKCPCEVDDKDIILWEKARQAIAKAEGTL